MIEVYNHTKVGGVIVGTFSAGICPRINDGKVEILCVYVRRTGLYGATDLYAFPGDKYPISEDTPVEIFERVFYWKTGLRAISSRLVFFDRARKGEGNNEDRYFWLVTDYEKDLLCEENLELPQGTKLVWEEISGLRGLIYETHQIGLTCAIKSLARIDGDFAIPLYYACPELFRAK